MIPRGETRFTLALLCVVSLACRNRETDKIDTKVAPIATESSVAPTPIKVPDNTTWRYTRTKGEMDKFESCDAHLESVENIDLSFPYGGEQKIKLRLSQNQNEKKPGVYIFLRKGQFPSGRTGRWRIKFDDGPAESLDILYEQSPGLAMAEVKFPNQLVNQFKSHKSVKIQVPFFREPSAILTFKVDGLQWPIPSSVKLNGGKN